MHQVSYHNNTSIDLHDTAVDLHYTAVDHRDWIGQARQHS